VPDNQLIPDPTPELADLINQVRVLFSRAVNVWGAVYTTEGGAHRDEAASAKADVAMVDWIRQHREWPQAKQYLLRIVELDNRLMRTATATPNNKREGTPT
jgi:hypothetical protein